MSDDNEDYNEDNINTNDYEYKLVIEKHSDTISTYKYKGQDHTLCGLVVSSLNKNSGVILSNYKIEHPLLKICNIRIHTKLMDPNDIMINTLNDLEKQFSVLEKFFK